MRFWRGTREPTNTGVPPRISGSLWTILDPSSIRHTIFDCAWSSAVCSSVLLTLRLSCGARAPQRLRPRPPARRLLQPVVRGRTVDVGHRLTLDDRPIRQHIERGGTSAVYVHLVTTSGEGLGRPIFLNPLRQHPVYDFADVAHSPSGVPNKPSGPTSWILQIVTS